MILQGILCRIEEKGDEWMDQNGYGNVKYCQYCGGELAPEAVVCIHCGRQVGPMAQQGPQVIVQNNLLYPNARDKWVAFLLCLFLGVLGAHKFYEGKTGMGLLYLFTGGLCGIGAVVDCIILLCKPNPYYV